MDEDCRIGFCAMAKIQMSLVIIGNHNGPVSAGIKVELVSPGVKIKHWFTIGPGYDVTQVRFATQIGDSGNMQFIR